MANPTGKGGFTKGDPRINRKGRPKGFDALRTLSQQIAHEVAKTTKEGVTTDVVISGRKVTVTEMILRQWAQSKNPKLQVAFMEIAYGKVPDRTEVTGKDGGPVETNDVGLSDGERATRILAILDAARARRDRSPAGDVGADVS